MRWTFRLTQPDLKQARTVEPLHLATIAWLLVLVSVYAGAGAALTIGAIPWGVVVVLLLMAICLAWLKTYSWVNDMQQSLADFLMPLVGVLAGLVGACGAFWFGKGHPAMFWQDPIVLIGLLPATAAFRGSLSFAQWVQSIQEMLQQQTVDSQTKLPKLRGLQLLPWGLLLAIGLCVVCYGLASAGRLATWMAPGLATVIIALPTAVYLYLAYALLPKIVGERMDQALQQLSSTPLVKEFLDKQKQDKQTLDVEAIEVQPTALPPTPGSQSANVLPKDLNLEDTLKQQINKPQWMMQLIVPALVLLFGSVLISYLYWKINQWIAAALVLVLDFGLPIELSVNWGWDWFRGWMLAWIVAVLIAVVRVAKRMILWPSLLYTLSIVGGALLIPTALIWGLRSGWAAMLGVAWAACLGLSLAQASGGLARSVEPKNSWFVLSIVSLLGLGLGRVAIELMGLYP